MEIISYNINGIRASVKAGLIEFIESTNADVYCFQEVRCGEQLAREVLFKEHEQLDFLSSAVESKMKNYTAIFNCGNVSGYAGTMILSKSAPDKVFYDMGEFWKDDEGRTTTIVLGELAIVCAYIPNGNSRLDFKMKYLDALTKYITFLAKDYDVLCAGDYNIAHSEIDLTNPKECSNKSVFLPIEREAFSKILKQGFIDTFRHLNKNLVKYSWRSYRSVYDKSYNSWKYRIDYILASASLEKRLLSADILEANASDHLPVLLELN